MNPKYRTGQMVEYCGTQLEVVSIAWNGPLSSYVYNLLEVSTNTAINGAEERDIKPAASLRPIHTRPNSNAQPVPKFLLGSKVYHQGQPFTVTGWRHNSVTNEYTYNLSNGFGTTGTDIEESDLTTQSPVLGAAFKVGDSVNHSAYPRESFEVIAVHGSNASNVSKLLGQVSYDLRSAQSGILTAVFEKFLSQPGASAPKTLFNIGDLVTFNSYPNEIYKISSKYTPYSGYGGYVYDLIAQSGGGQNVSYADESDLSPYQSPLNNAQAPANYMPPIQPVPHAMKFSHNLPYPVSVVSSLSHPSIAKDDCECRGDEFRCQPCLNAHIRESSRSECECGAHKLKDSGHAYWCKMFKPYGAS